nr:HAD family hydrolase [uncultured Ruminococcus sp.]
MNRKLVIFDMDGTILDTLEDLKDALNHVLTQHSFPVRTLDEVRRFVGNGIYKLIERGVPAGTPQQEIDAVYEDFKPYYAAHCEDTTKAYDGIPALLRQLKAQGFAVAVVSNKADFAVQKLCEVYFPDTFDAALGEREGVRKKPAPDSVNEVLRQLQIPREQAVYVGDSDVDIETAKNANMPCLSVTWGFRDEAFLLEHGASHILHMPEEILQFVTQR